MGDVVDLGAGTHRDIVGVVVVVVWLLVAVEIVVVGGTVCGTMSWVVAVGLWVLVGKVTLLGSRVRLVVVEPIWYRGWHW